MRSVPYAHPIAHAPPLKRLLIHAHPFGRPHPAPHPPQLIGRVLGHGGEIIKAIQRSSGCKVHLHTLGPDSPACDVEFAGTSAENAAAVGLFRGAMAAGHRAGGAGALLLPGSAVSGGAPAAGGAASPPGSGQAAFPSSASAPTAAALFTSMPGAGGFGSFGSSCGSYGAHGSPTGGAALAPPPGFAAYPPAPPYGCYGGGPPFSPAWPPPSSALPPQEAAYAAAAAAYAGVMGSAAPPAAATPPTEVAAYHGVQPQPQFPWGVPFYCYNPYLPSYSGWSLDPAYGWAAAYSPQAQAATAAQAAAASMSGRLRETSKRPAPASHARAEGG